MSESVFFFRGQFPDGLAPGTVSGEMVLDLKQVAGISPQALSEIVEELTREEVFLSRQSLAAILAKRLGNREQAASLEKVLWNLSDKSDKTTGLADAIQEWREEDEENKGLLSEEDLKKIRDVLPLLTRRIPGISKWKKANRVAGLTGVKLKDFQLVCDLRPVFDEGRNAIEAVVPTTTLRVVWETEAGLPDAVEAQLTRKQVAELSDKLRQLEQKLATIDGFAKAHKLVVPEISRTTRSD